jgi:hypothetical protein
VRRYAIVGPVNVGKSSLFYALTGLYVKTANYPGTTVEIHKAYLRRDGEKIEIVDLPGVLNPENPRDEDEKIAMKEIAKGSYDGVVVVAAPHAVGNALTLAEVAGSRGFQHGRPLDPALFGGGAFQGPWRACGLRVGHQEKRRGKAGEAVGRGASQEDTAPNQVATSRCRGG